jgi:hypothetical protein
MVHLEECFAARLSSHPAATLYSSSCLVATYSAWVLVILISYLSPNCVEYILKYYIGWIYGDQLYLKYRR